MMKSNDISSTLFCKTKIKSQISQVTLKIQTGHYIGKIFHNEVERSAIFSLLSNSLLYPISGNNNFGHTNNF